MNESKADAAQRLERVERVFAARRARLASDVAREPPRFTGSGSLANLQHHGYSVALMLALTAMLPSVVGFAFRRRKLLFSTLMTAMRARKWRARFKSAQIAGRGR